MTDQELIKNIKVLVHKIWEIEDTLGWHDEPTTLSERLSNITAEIGEVWEEYRKFHELTETYYECKADKHYKAQNCFELCIKDQDGKDEKCKTCPYGKPCGIPSEFADIIIWIMDYCQEVGIPIGEMILEKLEYNSHRSYKHGKKV